MENTLFIIFMRKDWDKEVFKQLEIPEFGNPSKYIGVINKDMETYYCNSIDPPNDKEHSEAKVLVILDASKNNFKKHITPYIKAKTQFYVTYHDGSSFKYEQKELLKSIDKDKCKGDYYCSHNYDSSSVYYIELKKIAKAKYEGKIADFNEALQELLQRFQLKSAKECVIGIIKKCSILYRNSVEDPELNVKDELKGIKNAYIFTDHQDFHNIWERFLKDLNNDNMSEKIEEMQDALFKLI
jgi:hypothetical protein